MLRCPVSSIFKALLAIFDSQDDKLTTWPPFSKRFWFQTVRSSYGLIREFLSFSLIFLCIKFLRTSFRFPSAHESIYCNSLLCGQK